MLQEEKETIVRFDYVDGKVSVWSTQRAIWKKLETARWALVSEAKSAAGRSIGREYVATHGDIRISFKKIGREKIKTGFALRKPVSE